ncbi:hypothetical protein FGW37_01960 [Streptomyces rectiverticillatus]|nr:hypothetical protein [Streptomyces rectiverticillatus]QLE70533.1 hypothetical protein FGW37_01960 [Streptomyces rectiverticillatus]
MALPRKGSRRIVVDGVAYRWRVRRRVTYGQGMGWSLLAYAVEHAESPGTTLVVRTGRPHPGNWIRRPAPPVLPAHVSAAVRAARARGWTPEAPGPPFLLDESGGMVAYPAAGPVDPTTA